MSERRYDVITFGDMCVDLIVTGTDVVPRFGQVEKLVDDYVREGKKEYSPMTELTSRERMLRALNLEEPDHVPCCFMSFTALRRRHHENMYELSKAERAMGLDSMLFIPVAPRPQRPEHPDLRGLPVGFAPEVEIKEWREEVEGGFGILHKEYSTPGGKLATSVRSLADWPHGDQIPFVDDYQVPRSLKPLITGPEELEALQYQ